jgi:hypothetical protein
MSTFIKPEVILPCSQEDTTGPYHNTDDSSPHYHPTTLIRRSVLILSSDVRCAVVFPSAFPTKLLYAHEFLIINPHECYMPCPSLIAWFYEPIKTVNVRALEHIKFETCSSGHNTCNDVSRAIKWTTSASMWSKINVVTLRKMTHREIWTDTWRFFAYDGG